MEAVYGSESVTEEDWRPVGEVFTQHGIDEPRFSESFTSRVALAAVAETRFKFLGCKAALVEQARDLNREAEADPDFPF